VHVAHAANAQSNTLGSKRKLFPCNFATIIKQDSFFLWRKSSTVAMHPSRLALVEWLKACFLN
jgi:hypothetical protein